MQPDPQREIIGNREILRESHDPETIRYRDGETDTLTTLLSPTLGGGITETALIYGPPGSGKTCTTTAVLEEIETEHSVPTAMVDCWDDHKPSRALYSILESLTGATAYDRDQAPEGVLLDAIEEAIDEPTILFLDEADKLDEVAILRDLYEIDGVRLLFAANERHQVVGDLDHSSTRESP